MRFIKIITFICTLLVLPSAAQAQGHSAFCGQVDSTAASQACLKRHLDSAQRRLNKVYKNLNNTLEGDELKQLKELQSIWLTYRDQECMWEAESSVEPGLKRINELSCMARVTEDRADLLTVIRMDSELEAAPREYGSFPRWMNVVAKDYPDAYWDYYKRRSYDLDCDGEEEFVMTGIETIPNNVKLKEGGVSKTKNFAKNFVVAVVQNPSVGRPKADVFKFPVKLEEDSNSICNDSVSFALIEEKEDQQKREEETKKVCLSYLKMAPKGCQDKAIIWNEKNFVLKIKEKENHLEKKKK